MFLPALFGPLLQTVQSVLNPVKVLHLKFGMTKVLVQIWMELSGLYMVNLAPRSQNWAHSGEN